MFSEDIKGKVDAQLVINPTSNIAYFTQYLGISELFLKNYRYVENFSFKHGGKNDILTMAKEKDWQILGCLTEPHRTSYFVTLGDGQAVLMNVGTRNVAGWYYGASHKHVGATKELFEATWPKVKVSRDKSVVPINFWSFDPANGGICRERDIQSLDWKDITSNYAGDVRTKLSDVMNVIPPIDGGKLILWHGEPGTGKSNAIRALANQWLPWCDVHYVVDPESFFGQANYMLQVVLNEAGDETYWYDEDDPDDDSGLSKSDDYILQGAKRWKLLIVEDADEFLQADAKERTGQALSRLLNLGDGLVGQGLNYITLLTTNAKMSDIHAAVSREGRCMSNIEFMAFRPAEAKAWADSMELEIPSEKKDKPLTLAALYDLRRNRQQIKTIKEEFRTGQYL